jgi:hypothetical protein
MGSTTRPVFLSSKAPAAPAVEFYNIRFGMGLTHQENRPRRVFECAVTVNEKRIFG